MNVYITDKVVKNKLIMSITSLKETRTNLIKAGNGNMKRISLYILSDICRQTKIHYKRVLY